MSWKPKSFHKNPMVNAVLNLAAETHRQALATEKLFYAFKFSENEGCSVGEAPVIAARIISEAITNAAEITRKVVVRNDD